MIIHPITPIGLSGYLIVNRGGVTIWCVRMIACVSICPSLLDFFGGVLIIVFVLVVVLVLYLVVVVEIVVLLCDKA